MGEPKLLSLPEIAEELGVSVHVVRIAAANLRDRITWEPGLLEGGRRDGRRRLYGPEAVSSIRQYVKKVQARRAQTSDQAAAYWQGLARLRLVAGSFGSTASELRELYKLLRKNPPTVGTYISTLPEKGLALVQPIPVLISPLRRIYWRASMPEARLFGDGKTHDEALVVLRDEILRAYRELSDEPDRDPARWMVLDQLIRQKRPRKAWKLGPAQKDTDSREDE